MPCPYCPSVKQEHWPQWPTCCSCLPLQKPCSQPAVDSLPLQRAWQWRCWLWQRRAQQKSEKEQVDRSISYPDATTILKAKQHSKWRHKHPRYNKADPYYMSTRREQKTVFRLRTGHNHLNYHCILNSASAIQNSAFAVLAVRQQNICCWPAPSTSCSERESGQTTLL